jgi:hypothetical protein
MLLHGRRVSLIILEDTLDERNRGVCDESATQKLNNSSGPWIALNDVGAPIGHGEFDAFEATRAAQGI